MNRGRERSSRGERLESVGLRRKQEKKSSGKEEEVEEEEEKDWK